MGWRNVMISNPARLSLGQGSLHIMQEERDEKNTAKIPLEDISVLVIDQPQVTLTAQLLSACAEAQIVILTVNDKHLPNGAFLPYLPHSRALKVMQAQLALSQPAQKRLWQGIVQQKILNQAAVLQGGEHQKARQQLTMMSKRVRSGDPDNLEAQAAQLYFPTLFSKGFTRQQTRFYNSALNYGYAILRAAIARTLCAYGFLPAWGLHHHNELNSFNLADDIIEPYRPLVDQKILTLHAAEPVTINGDPRDDLTHPDKVEMVGLLHQDIRLTQHIGMESTCTVMAAIEATVISLSQVVQNNMDDYSLVMPKMNKSAIVH